jgi:hypothetical protein
MLTHRKPIIYFWFKSQIFGFEHENDDDFKIWRRKPMEQRERNSRRPSRNGLRFFAGCAAQKWSPFGAAEANFERQG